MWHGRKRWPVPGGQKHMRSLLLIHFGCGGGNGWGKRGGGNGVGETVVGETVSGTIVPRIVQFDHLHAGRSIVEDSLPNVRVVTEHSYSARERQGALKGSEVFSGAVRAIP